MLPTAEQLLTSALRYAELGYPVFPLAPGTKVPWTGNGHLDATTDPERIEAWWKQRPTSNIGIAADGLVVVDIDAEDNPWLVGEPEKQLDLACAPLSLTANDGRQHVFRQPDGRGWRCTTSRLAPKVDTRANGGYIVAPPSVLAGGRLYRWAPDQELDVPPERLPEPPDWLVRELDALAAGGPTSAHVAAEGNGSNQIPTGQRNATLARLAGTMRRVGMSEAEILAALLKANDGRCVPPLERREVEKIAESIGRYEPDQISVALVENHWAQMQAESVTAEVPADPGPFPQELIDAVPPIVHRAMEYYLRHAVEAQPVLFLASMIAATGAILGHKVRDASGLRTNIYTLGITRSGGGKEATREVVRKIFRQSGLEKMCGPEDFASDAGLIAAVERQNPILFQLDEFGRLMHCVNAGSNNSPHLYNIASVLLKFYGKAGSVFRSKAYADPKRNKQIAQPHVCVYGTTVSTNFWKSMEVDSLEGGFLPRLLIFESKADPIAGGAAESEPPVEVVNFFATWAQRKMSGGNLESAYPQPMVVPYTAEATKVMDELKALQKSEEQRYGEIGPIWSRARENAGKLAMIYACWQDPESPIVEREAAEWATRVTTHAVRHALYEANLCMSEGAFHERCQKILRVLKQHGIEITRSTLMRSTRNMTLRERDEALATLHGQGLISIRQEATGGRPLTHYKAV